MFCPFLTGLSAHLVPIDPRLSVNDSCFSSVHGPDHPNEDALLVPASCTAGKEW